MALKVALRTKVKRNRQRRNGSALHPRRRTFPEGSLSEGRLADPWADVATRTEETWPPALDEGTPLFGEARPGHSLEAISIYDPEQMPVAMPLVWVLAPSDALADSEERDDSGAEQPGPEPAEAAANTPDQEQAEVTPAAPETGAEPVGASRDRDSSRQIGPETAAQGQEIADHESAETALQVTETAKDLEAAEAAETDPQQLIDQATAGPATELPQRSTLETYLERPLSEIEVFTGPAAQESLEALEAEAATRGQQMVLADPQPDLETVIHEVIHVLQAEQGVAESEGDVAAEESPPEQEAGLLAPQLAGDITTDSNEAGRQAPEPSRGSDETGRPSITAGLGAQTVALTRTTRATPLPANADTTAAAPAERFATAVVEREPARRVRAAPNGRAAAPAAAPGAAAPLAAEGEEAPTLELPPAPEPGVTEADVAAHQAEVEQAAAALEGAENAAGLVGAFADAPPTLKAQQNAQIGERVNEVTQAEESTYQAELPQLHAELNSQVEPTEELTVTTPESREVNLEATPPAPAPEPDIPPTPDLGRYTANEGITRGITRRLEGSPEGRAEQVGETLREVRTTDPIDASPGPPPGVPLEGETDPARVDNQAGEGVSQARQTRDEAHRAVLEGPGPEQVQPLAMDEVHGVEELNQPAIEAPPPAEGPQAYLEMEMPPEVQTSFDQQNQEQMQGSLQEARTQVDQATAERDQAREARVQEAETQAETLSEEADQDQRDRVVETRGRIQSERQSTLDAQTEAVTDLESDVETRREADRRSIDDRVSEDESQIEDCYTQTETEAQAEVQDGERRAEAKREEAEREAEDQSWWDRAVNFVQRAFEALTSAIGVIFDGVRAAVNTLLDGAKAFAEGLIEAAATFIKNAVAAFGEFLTSAITALLGDVFPELAERLNGYINDAVTAVQQAVDEVAERLRAGIAALIDGLKAGLNAILDAFEGALRFATQLLQAALTGDWAALARMVLEAILNVLGIDPAQFYAFVGRAQETFQMILDDPGAFLGHCVDAFVGGVRKFRDNFLTHLQAGIIGWLTGQLGSAGITLPQQFDIWGVLDLVRQILGLTWERLRQKAVRLVGERAVAMLEFVGSYIQTLVEGGWSALFERIRGELGNLRDRILDQIKSFLIERIVIAAITRLATMFNPVGAILNLVLTIYNLVMFLVNQMQRIIAVARSIIDAIGEIARGNTEPAAKRVEEILGNLLPIALALLARLIGLGNVGGRVRRILQGVQQAIDRAIDRLIQRVLARFRGRGTRGTATAAEGAVARQIGQRLTFRAGPETHRLYIDVRGRDAVVMVATAPQSLNDWISLWRNRVDSLAVNEKPAARRLIDEAEAALQNADRNADRIAAARQAGGPQSATANNANNAVIGEQRHLVTILDNLFLLFGDERQPLGANAADRFEMAQSVNRFQQAFISRDWEAQFMLRSSTARQDIRWGRSQSPPLAEAVSGQPNTYRLSLSDNQLVQLAVRLVKEQGRRSDLLQDPFTLEELKRFFVANPRLPNAESRYPSPLINRIAQALVTANEVEPPDRGNYIYSPLPPERRLPDRWKGKDVRNKYYINGSGFGSARRRVFDRDFRRIQDAINAIRAGNSQGYDQWDTLFGLGMVADQEYDPTKADADYKEEGLFDVDHRKPLAWHWDREDGNNTPWNVRQRLAGDVSGNLRILLSSKNQSKGSDYEEESDTSGAKRATYSNKWWVGPNFTGPGTAKGPTWADENTPFENFK